MCIYFAATYQLVAMFVYGTMYIYMCVSVCGHPIILIILLYLSFVHCGYTFIGLSTASYLIRINICDNTCDICDNLIDKSCDNR